MIKIIYLLLLFFHFFDFSFQIESNNDLCDITVENGVCIFDGLKVIIPAAKPAGLLGHWSFNEIKVNIPEKFILNKKILDHSGNENHAKNQIKAGPSYSGIGNSAYFDGYDFLEIPHSSDFTSKEFTITFWIFIIKELTDDIKNKKGLRWCPILHKGVDDIFQSVFLRSPAIFFDRKDKGLKISLTTSAMEKFPQGENLFSNARLSYQRWHHIALIVSENKMKLYVNGILDAVNITEGNIMINEMALFVGGTPWHRENCNLPSYIDELRFYNRILNEEELEAEAAPALGGIEPNFINLGCIDCPLETAAKSCNNGYHLCTSVELHTGGYQVARAMGWIEWNSNIWSHGALLKSDNIENLGLGLCCLDIK